MVMTDDGRRYHAPTRMWTLAAKVPQRQWREALQEQGYMAALCFGLDATTRDTKNRIDYNFSRNL